MKKLTPIIKNLVNEAEQLAGKTGKEKKDYVLKKIAELDDKTFLKVIPNGFEEFMLNKLIDFAVAFLKSKI